MKILKIFLFWRLGLLIITFLGSSVFPRLPNQGLGAIRLNQNFDYWLSWAQWDGGHYWQIAKNGYIATSDYAFFPLYPLLVRSISTLLSDNLILAGLLASNLAFLIFLIVFYEVAKKQFSQKVALTTTVTFLVFPTTFFAVSMYSESLFLLSLVCFFYFLKGKKYLWASIMVSLASLTRLVGITLVVSLLYSYVSSLNFDFKKIDRKILLLFPATFGFIIYSLYLFASLNDPVNYLTTQAFWQRSVTDPVSTIFTYIWAFVIGEHRPTNDYFDFAITILFISILILGIKKIPSSWWISSMLVILIPASSGTLTSMPRYLLASLGAFVILGQYLEIRPKIRNMLWAISLATQAILAVRFINGYWVA